MNSEITSFARLRQEAERNQLPNFATMRKAELETALDDEDDDFEIFALNGLNGDCLTSDDFEVSADELETPSADPNHASTTKNNR